MLIHGLPPAFLAGEVHQIGEAITTLVQHEIHQFIEVGIPVRKVNKYLIFRVRPGCYLIRPERMEVFRIILVA
jgi:hypothetical protein